MRARVNYSLMKAAIGCRNVWITVPVFWLAQWIDQEEVVKHSTTLPKCPKHYHSKICTHKRYIQLVIAITLCKAYEYFGFIHICQCKHTHKTQNRNTALLKWKPNTVPVVTSASLPCTSCCTYEVSWHLVVLGHPADLTQLQQGVNVVRIQVQDSLQRSSTPSC